MLDQKIYLILGKQRFFLEKKIKKLINDSQKKSYDVIYYQMKKDLYSNLAKELQTSSLISSTMHKIIVVDYSEILLQAKSEEIAFLKSYFQKPHPEISLYFFAEKNFYNAQTNKLFQKYCHCQTIAFLEKKDFFDYVLKKFEKDGFQIEKKAILYLIKQTGYNLYFLEQEIQKLKLCQLEDKTITYQLVKKLSVFNKEDNIFTLIHFFLNNDRIETYELYQKLKAQKVSDFQIMYQLINQIKDLLLVKDITNATNNQTKLAQILKCSSAKAFILNKEAKTLQAHQDLKNCFLALIELEYQAKTGVINLNIGLELFFLGKNNILQDQNLL
ncbi:DNA polymerase III subunit delta [Candidatus Phytoplasma solani]|uniref:DNA polymerase III subunit delta n=1 Tax=Candidatus Phytoplasma solani TaxID=69896 RepID=UPI00358F6CD8